MNDALLYTEIGKPTAVVHTRAPMTRYKPCRYSQDVHVSCESTQPIRAHPYQRTICSPANPPTLLVIRTEQTETYTWFITGANRGIGLELTKQLLESPANTVLAACRNPGQADALNALAQFDLGKGRMHVLPLEITDRQSVREAARVVGEIVGERGLDFLVNNAAINVEEWDAPSTLQPEVMQAVFATNVIAPAYITQVFLPLVEKSKGRTVVNVSSTLGSLGADGFGTRSTSYAISKAALNMVTYKQQKERPDIIFISMCPGWLRTDMGGEEAPNDVETGVAGVLKTIEGLTLADSSKFFNFKGEIVPW